ncbi:hypothetical protein ABB37_09745 [Leptomonas pyrrhocoris]|uniref:GPR1/FUN34/yaaH family n=1 Tax=Leptomonas pyrrhocoris TaxID=157538 RepID=A0A0M9FPZ7_LEPPY|nr:hypothetical protein ABB37_09745 [Leptomonas pyrrhocoris]KPA73613.1 hypothetical protein ABB37_09745 [Leptomonas pyrrhocoris]|eukprot:XP_015652052.1 hypothetical protein ABB37_09745 [Leptomonas pyrrhocoris]
MFSHTPHPREEEEVPAVPAPTAPAGKHHDVPPCAAATAPSGKPQDPPAFDDATPNENLNQHSSGKATNPPHETHSVDVTEYVTPMTVEAAAAPPVRTIVETTQAAGAPDTAAANPRSNQKSSNSNQNANPLDRTTPIEAPPQSVVTVPGATVTTTRIVTLQPCKIVYHYADNTAHTYVLQSTTFTPCAAAAAAATSSSPAESYARNTHEPLPRRARGGRTHPQQQQHAAAAVRIPASHGGDSSSLASFGSDDSDVDVNAEERKFFSSTSCATCGRGDGAAAAGGCLAAVYKPPEYVADITPANPRIGSPGPVTLFAFGFTTCLYNVHQAGICPMNLTTMGLICFYGGLAQFVGGFFELMNKNTIFCTLDVTYGAFWMATAITNLVPENANVVGSAPPHYMGGFFMLWFFFAATMFASSFKFSYVQMLLNFSVALNFFLNFLGSFIGSATLLHVAGFEGIVEGCLATYVGMAFTMRDIYGHSVLPLFFQKNFKITEW